LLTFLVVVLNNKAKSKALKALKALKKKKTQMNANV